MSVTVSKSAVIELIRELLDDSQKKDAPAVVVEPPVEELPVDPNPEVGTEGVFELPPVDDADFEPGTPEELSKAAFAVAKQIPSQHVHQFWKKLDRLAAEAETWQEEETMKTDQMESTIRRHVRKILKEAWYDEEDDEDFEFDEKELDAERRAGWDRARANAKPSWGDINLKKWTDPDALKPEEPVVSADDELEVGERYREATWQEIADLMGFKSPSGAKQMVDDPGRLGDKFRFLFKIFSEHPEMFEKIRKTGVEEYAKALLAADAIEQEDADYLLQNPEHVYGLESYRAFMKKFMNKAVRAYPGWDEHVQSQRDKAAAERAAKKAARAAKKRG